MGVGVAERFDLHTYEKGSNSYTVKGSLDTFVLFLFTIAFWSKEAAMKTFLQLHVEGATEAEETRGLEAAAALLMRAGVDPADAASGHFAREGWDMRGFPENDPGFTDEDAKNAALWDQAALAALEACCADWPADRPRPEVELEFILDDEAKAALYAAYDDDNDDDPKFSPEQQVAYENWLRAGKPMN